MDRIFCVYLFDPLGIVIVKIYSFLIDHFLYHKFNVKSGEIKALALTVLQCISPFRSVNFEVLYSKCLNTHYIYFFGGGSFCLFRATPTACGGSKVRGLIGDAAAGLRQSHSNARSDPCLQPTPHLMAMPHP